MDDLVVTCDEIVYTPKTALINFDDKTNYWLLCTVFLTVACLILLLVDGDKYYMKCG